METLLLSGSPNVCSILVQKCTVKFKKIITLLCACVILSGFTNARAAADNNGYVHNASSSEDFFSSIRAIRRT